MKYKRFYRDNYIKYLIYMRRAKTKEKISKNYNKLIHLQMWRKIYENQNKI